MTRKKKAPAPDADTPNVTSEQQLQKIVQLMQQAALMEQSAAKKLPKTEHKFWNTQPVPQPEEADIEVEGPIEPDVPVDQVRQEPYPLPGEFEWCTVDVTAPNELQHVYDLLTYHYVEDDDAMFRFDYSNAFLQWAFCPPGWIKEWHVGVRVKASKKLIAFICGVPIHMRIKTPHAKGMVEINFLCVHKKLRSKRLAPVLIKEVTRRVNLTGIFQAVYTAGVKLPKPVSTCRYHHRSLNQQKLVDTGFSHIPSGMTFSQYKKKYALPASTQLKGLQAMQPHDVPEARALLNRYLVHVSDIGPLFETDEDFAHWVCPVPDVLWSWVARDDQGKMTAMVSFYSLPSTIIHHPIHKTLRAAYLYYYAVDADLADEERRELVKKLVQDALIQAKALGFDVFNCLALLENKHFLQDLKFGPGDGYLNYYLYNYRCKTIPDERMGLVML
jgi:glycylpeptide N-tetradecanoyltransferase